MKKGFKANIYFHSSPDIFSPMKDAKEVVIINSGLPEMDKPTNNRPAVRIVNRVLFGKIYTHVQPTNNGLNWAFGGRFIWRNDSRFREHFPNPLPLHDRNMDLEVR
jgi:hypothetical protein